MGINVGIFGMEVFNVNPPMNPDGSYPLLHEKGLVGSFLKALVGYDGNPELLQVIVYFAYWIIIGIYLLRTHNES